MIIISVKFGLYYVLKNYWVRRVLLEWEGIVFIENFLFLFFLVKI